MPKSTFNDIVPPERRSIRNIKRTQAPHVRIPEVSEEENAESSFAPPPTGFSNRKNMFFFRYGFWVIGLVVLLLFIVGFSLLFSGSKIVVTPMQKEVQVSGQFTAVRESTRDQLPYEVMEFERFFEDTLTSTGTEAVEERASGTIIVFNDFSEKEQRLITNTRFETTDGLIYRIREPLVVPGQQKNEKGDTVPGSIEVVIYADEPGSRHNIGLVDFTIPGFKGAPQFDDFYARSKTSMTGGFVGKRVTVDTGALEEVTGELKEELKVALFEEARKNKPDGFVFFENALFFEFPEAEISEEGDDMANIIQRGKAYGIIFREEEFSRYIVLETVAGYDGEPIRLNSTDNLVLTFNEDFVFSPTEEDNFVFTLSGETRAVWLFDEQQLKNDLSGREKGALTTILSGYPGIERAEVVLRPFWKQAFPEDPNKITVDIKLF